MQAHLSDPTDPETFACSKLDLSERQHHAQMYALHRDLLRLRRTSWYSGPSAVVVWMGRCWGRSVCAALLWAHGDDRLLVVNLGHALHLNPAPEPLLAPPEGMGWAILWSTEDPRYGGVAQHPWRKITGIFQAMPRWCSDPIPARNERNSHRGRGKSHTGPEPRLPGSARTGSGGCNIFLSRRIACNFMPGSRSGMLCT